jgi:hypothetical protein
MNDYRQIVLWLMEEGNEPLLKKLNGGVFRFYVDKDSEYYEEGSTMFEACEQATNLWIARELPESI